MKHFSIAIKSDENQDKVSTLLTNLNTEINHVESVGGVIDHLYITQSSRHDPQTHANVYYQSNVSVDEYEEIHQEQFEGSGKDVIAAFLTANDLLRQWVVEVEPGDIYDIKFDFYVGEAGDDVVVASIFYDKKD